MTQRWHVTCCSLVGCLSDWSRFFTHTHSNTKTIVMHNNDAFILKTSSTWMNRECNLWTRSFTPAHSGWGWWWCRWWSLQVIIMWHKSSLLSLPSGMSEVQSGDGCYCWALLYLINFSHFVKPFVPDDFMKYDEEKYHMFWSVLKSDMNIPQERI